ncbi:class III extradiol ring-cleavage dioxygenase [Candidatus Thiothrix sp. Deng01]|uniref:Class III extradiol ring-cleavage dioxygenase n=1 Tax=Candidatus Thiothrix phosphatis TaxID=3112415 RepID=A0ABU6CVU3_9GAMM|nr:class III extradiol ring-cleavage dioxygenase [Candidatus Thiothrix sp. Deng01]MEB4590909.1 class III extradiol ring-cleavage dioxygenase [Candidatus Thiothrix sp. Deng01]
MMFSPLVFVSHGAPDVALQDWRRLGETLPRPRAILLLSAHWETAQPVISTAAQPQTIHDFGGFPHALYQMQYPAPGAPELADQIGECLVAGGFTLARHPQRGLDHGAWIPLRSMYPQADVPVTQLSIQTQGGAEWHWRLGQALRPLREDNVLIMTSGSVTHNFGWMSRTREPLPKAQVFSGWLGEKLAARDLPALLDYRRQAPYGAEAHPTEEHLLPLFVALGASREDEPLARFAPEYCYGGLAMDMYVWGS